jgi:hypothetical protein
MLATHTVWFPLASNTSYFELTEPRVGLEARIKQMALLADELLFEPGVLDVSVGESGLVNLTHPPGSMTHDEMRQRRVEVKKGTPFQLAIAPQSAVGVPATEGFTTIIGGPLEHAFFVEYETRLLDWGLGDVPWMQLAWPKPELAQVVKELADAADRQEKFDRDAPRIAENTFLDGRMKQDLNLDLAAGTVDHDAVGAFRAALIEAEEKVSGLPENERREVLHELHVEVLARKLVELMPSYDKLVLDLGRGLLFDAISSVIPFASTVENALSGLAEVRREKSEWTAVLLTLHAKSLSDGE